MVAPVMTTHPSATSLEAATKMRELYVGCLPVVEEGELVGIVTGSDMLGLLVQELSLKESEV